MASPRVRTATRVRTGTETETQAEIAEEKVDPPRYPYLPCGYESERRQDYLDWLEGAEAGGDTETPAASEERFSTLLGVWAGFTETNPIDWFPVYEDLKAGDIAVLRLSDCYAPDWVRDGRTVGSTLDISSDQVVGRPDTTLPRGPELDELIESAASVLRPPMDLPDLPVRESGLHGRYLLPPHEIFSESATVFGLGPIGLGLVIEDAEPGPADGYHHAPVGMFLPFPVELLDHLLDPSRHEGEWFRGFSVTELDGIACPMRASIPERQGKKELSYLTETEFRRFTNWIVSEFDPDGWFEENLGKLEQASRRIREGGVDPLGERGDESEDFGSGDGEVREWDRDGWESWRLSSPHEDAQAQSLWGMSQLRLAGHERTLHGLERFCRRDDLGEHGGRLRYSVERYREHTRDEARNTARALFSVNHRGHLPEDMLSGGDVILVSMAEHQLESIRTAIDAIDRGPILPYFGPDHFGYTKAPEEPSDLPAAVSDLFSSTIEAIVTSDLWRSKVDVRWSETVDDLGFVYVGWLRGLHGQFPGALTGPFSVQLHGTSDTDLIKSFWRTSESAPSNLFQRSDESINRSFNQILRFEAGRDKLRLDAEVIVARSWNNLAHEGSRTRLVPISAMEALACWEAAFSLTSDLDRYVAPEPLYFPDEELRPEWLEDLRPLADGMSDKEILDLMQPRPTAVRDALAGILDKASSLL